MSNSQSMSQMESGKAWEYALAHALASQLGVPIEGGGPVQTALRSYQKLTGTPKRFVDKAAKQSAEFLIESDTRISNSTQCILLQGDAAGQAGDVRDIVIRTASTEIGISAKHRHAALKHPRVSDSKLDIVQKWIEEQSSPRYEHNIEAIFRNLFSFGVDTWSELPDKFGDFYRPMLTAIRDEIRYQYNKVDSDEHRASITNRLLRYLVGKHDFYKVIKENGTVAIQSFNLGKTLEWGKNTRLPTRITDIDFKPHSSTTLELQLDNGWALTLRIHNADKKIRKSLKFDIELEGRPRTLREHTLYIK